MAQSTGDLSPIREGYSDDLRETASFSSRGCCCFLNFSCFKSDDWERVSAEIEGSNRSWWDKGVRALRKVREWSELVAGPKWNTFIRRFNRAGGGRARPGRFGYDPLSYARNFDEGQNGQFESLVSRDFSSRYAAVQNGQSKDATSI